MKHHLIQEGYKQLNLKLKSGFSVEIYYKESYSQSYKEVTNQVLSHITFYGKTISETGFKSWFGVLPNEDVQKEIELLANHLEKTTLEANQNIL
ncbi:MAG: hypothetical protein N3A71_02085 [Candidatus Dojkabacteria bacterium]|nr:hypothetical protein [Candidatus Dojkabacteria bacterium]